MFASCFLFCFILNWRDEISPGVGGRVESYISSLPVFLEIKKDKGRWTHDLSRLFSDFMIRLKTDEGNILTLLNRKIGAVKVRILFFGLFFWAAMGGSPCHSSTFLFYLLSEVMKYLDFILYQAPFSFWLLTLQNGLLIPPAQQWLLTFVLLTNKLSEDRNDSLECLLSWSDCVMGQWLWTSVVETLDTKTNHKETHNNCKCAAAVSLDVLIDTKSTNISYYEWVKKQKWPLKTWDMKLKANFYRLRLSQGLF